MEDYEETPKEKELRRRMEYFDEHHDEELEKMKKYYADHKEYFKKKNKERYTRNKEKWAERRKDTSLMWSYRNCSPSVANGILEEFGLDISIIQSGRVSTFEVFSLLESFGYNLDDHHDYPPYEKRYRALIDEYRTLQDIQGLNL